jgi:hypothetical protein
MEPRVKFYLGAHHASQRWFDLDIPLFVSRRVLLAKKPVPAELLEGPRWEPGAYFQAAVAAEAEATGLRKKLPRATAGWALDSGGFTELSLFGEWRTSPARYVSDVRRLECEVGALLWAAPQDWMCEPFMLEKTGLTLEEHQRRTVDNYVLLREQLGDGVIPVLQGWLPDDYLRCWELYDRAGVDLRRCHTVGLGSVCRRQNMAEAGTIVRSLLPLRLHGFGVKMTGLESFGDALASADSMAWSFDGRRLKTPCPEGRKSCANCMHHALRWRAAVMHRVNQTRLKVECAA